VIGKLISIFKDSRESFEGQETGERVIMLLRKHAFVVLLSLSGFALACFVPILILTIFASFIINLNLLSLFLFLSSLWYMFLWLAVFRFLTIYTLNTVIITDHRVIEREQRGFFNQKVSELHAQKIQDITAHTEGIFETMLHFGNVVVQTAASEKQFVFHQIPEPEKVKDAIMKIVTSNKLEKKEV
jgi:hypothetical protein